MVHYHSIIWIDHHKAVVWNFNDDAQTKSIVKSRDQHQRIHVRKFANEGRHETPEELQFFRDVSQTLNGVEEIIVIGPAHAKDEFAAFLRKNFLRSAQKSSPSKPRIIRLMPSSLLTRVSISRCWIE